MHFDWATMSGGYGLPYDPRPAIANLRSEDTREGAWLELWQELHHQGDVGVASYASIPLLVDACADHPRDWNFFALVATIETERHRASNPRLPLWLSSSYREALDAARDFALNDLSTAVDAETVRTALALVALVSGATRLGAMLNYLDDGLVEAFTDEHLAWAELYTSPGNSK